MTYQLQTDTRIVKDYYCRIKAICEKTQTAKLQIKDRISGKQKIQKYPCSIVEKTVNIPQLSLDALNKIFFKTSQATVFVTQLSEHTLTNLFLYSNKEINEYLEIYDIDVLDFAESGLAGKYLVTLQFVQKETQKVLHKSYFCSITKKDTTQQKIHIYLTHLDLEELNKIFNQL